VYSSLRLGLGDHRITSTRLTSGMPRVGLMTSGSGSGSVSGVHHYTQNASDFDPHLLHPLSHTHTYAPSKATSSISSLALSKSHTQSQSQPDSRHAPRRHTHTRAESNAHTNGRRVHQHQHHYPHDEEDARLNPTNGTPRIWQANSRPASAVHANGGDLHHDARDDEFMPESDPIPGPSRLATATPTRSKNHHPHPHPRGAIPRMWQANSRPASGSGSGLGNGIIVNGYHHERQPGPSTSHTQPASIPRMWQASSVHGGSDPGGEAASLSDSGLGSELTPRARARALAHDAEAEDQDDEMWRWTHVSPSQLPHLNDHDDENENDDTSTISATSNMSTLKLNTEVFDETSSRKDLSPYYDHEVSRARTRTRTASTLSLFEPDSRLDMGDYAEEVVNIPVPISSTLLPLTSLPPAVAAVEDADLHLGERVESPEPLVGQFPFPTPPPSSAPTRTLRRASKRVSGLPDGGVVNGDVYGEGRRNGKGKEKAKYASGSTTTSNSSTGTVKPRVGDLDLDKALPEVPLIDTINGNADPQPPSPSKSSPTFPPTVPLPSRHLHPSSSQPLSRRHSARRSMDGPRTASTAPTPSNSDHSARAKSSTPLSSSVVPQHEHSNPTPSAKPKPKLKSRINLYGYGYMPPSLACDVQPEPSTSGGAAQMQMGHLECLAEYEEYESFTLGFGGGGEYLDALDFVGRTAAVGPSTSVGKGGNAVGAGAGSGSGSGSGSTTLRDKGSSESEGKGKGKGKERSPDPNVNDGPATTMNGFHTSAAAAVNGDNDNDLYLLANNGPLHVFDLVSERLLSDTYDDEGIRGSAPEAGSKSGSGSGAGAATRRTVTLNKWRERVVDPSDSCPPKKESESEKARECGEWEREVVWVGIGGEVWDEYPGRRKLRMRMQKMATTPTAGEEGDGLRSAHMKETGAKDVWPGVSVSASRSRSTSVGLGQEAKSTGTRGGMRKGTATATATMSASGEYHDGAGNGNEEGKARGKAKAGYGRAVSISPSCFFLLKRFCFADVLSFFFCTYLLDTLAERNELHSLFRTFVIPIPVET
jgi:hypothetical protein